ncbi:MAG TPA: D-glycero-beta-D-manno-heptose 1-phosphate adenylyltransferase [Syntrophobacteria bacterium]|nr:D-glycero-beta-D-manno-heptose 1-phosphate adenylyltransferase [Syntrophobacteria bacterium]
MGAEMREARKKVVPRRTLKRKVDALKGAGKRVVFTNGCFDLLHLGHIRSLQKARNLGDCLVVGINSDTSVREIKGAGRPIVPQQERAETLAALACVDWVTIFAEPDPLVLIKLLVPDVLVKGADWKEGEIIGAGVVRAAGGKVARINLKLGLSTTLLIEKILTRYADKGRGSSVDEVVDVEPRADEGC